MLQRTLRVVTQAKSLSDEAISMAFACFRTPSTRQVLDYAKDFSARDMCY